VNNNNPGGLNGAGALPVQNYHVNDRVTWTNNGHTLLGVVTSSDDYTFTVTWINSNRSARFTHDREPDTLRPTQPDEKPPTAADLLRQFVLDHPHWLLGHRVELTKLARRIEHTT
jgi:hypothetical protein